MATRLEEMTIMGAMKRWYEDCACRGIVPVSEECVDGLHCLRDDEGMPWIEITENGEDGPVITIATARRLIALGAADREITQFVQCFVECFGDCEPGTPATRCDDCGRAVEPGAGRASRHGERFCEECA